MNKHIMLPIVLTISSYFLLLETLPFFTNEPIIVVFFSCVGAFLVACTSKMLINRLKSSKEYWLYKWEMEKKNANRQR